MVERTTLRDQLEASFDEIESMQPEVKTEIPHDNEEPSEPETEERSGDAREQDTREQKARDERGRFASKDEERKKEEQPTKVRPKAPSSWKKEVVSKWETIDPEIAEYILQREEEMHRGISTYKTDAEVGRALKAEIAPYEPLIRAKGGQPEKVIGNLLRTAAILETGDPATKQQALIQIARDFGIPLPQGEQPQVDPIVNQLWQKYQQLENQFLTREQQREWAEQEALNSQIQRFAATHEHFERLRDHMGGLIQAGMAEGLEDAYDKALRLHDDLWRAQQAKQREADEAHRREEADKAAKAAKAAAVSVRGATPGAGLSNAPKGSLRSQLEEAFDAYAGRV